MKGRLAVSAMKPAAMTKASVAAGVKPSATSIAITMGVSINAAPSLAKNADTAAPSRTNSTKRSRPWPPPQRATCRAAHSKKPASSSSRLMMMMAMKVAVAFQTIFHTTGISPKLTAPKTSASTAPSVALQPIFRPLGCQITSTIVSRKMSNATTTGNSLCCGNGKAPSGDGGWKYFLQCALHGRCDRTDPVECFF